MTDQKPLLKIKLPVKRETSGEIPQNVNLGASIPLGAPKPTSTISLGNVGAAATAKPPSSAGLGSSALKTIKLGKLPKLATPSNAAQAPSITGPGPKSGASAGKRPAGGPTASAGAPKRFKLGGVGGGGAGLVPKLGDTKIKLGKADSLNLGSLKPREPSLGAPVGLAAPLPVPGAGQPFGVPMPKKRGRKPKGTVRPPRVSDEVKFHIAAPPPRSFSLRQATSQGTLHTESGRGPASPLSGAGLDTAATEGPGAILRSPTPVEQVVAGDDGGLEPQRPPTREELQRLLARIADKDTSSLFKQPVTDAEAPGYSTVITHPMDLSTMRAKLEAGAYSAWDTFAADLDLMFTNALTYNIKGDQVWVYTNRLKANAENMLRTAKAGRARVGGRGGSATTAARRKKQAEKAERKKEADQARAAARAEQRAAQEQKVLKRAGVAGTEEEDTARMTYKGAPGDGFLASWGGLGGGASGEGAPFGWGRQVIRPSNHIPSAAGYAASVLHFARNLKGKARAIAEKLAAIARAASDAVVYPPQAEDASTAAVAAGAKSGKGRKPKQQAQAQAQPSGAAAALVNPSLPPATLPSAAPLDLTSSYAQPAPALAAAQNARLMAAQTAAAVGAQPSAPVVAQLPGMNLGQLPFGMPMLQVGAGAAGQVFVPAAPGTVPAQQFVQLPQGATFLQPQQQQ